MIHNDRIDRLAGLLVRCTNRFRPGFPLTVVDRNRVAKLRLSLALALEEARRPLRRREETPDARRFAWSWLIPLNLPIRFRRPTDPIP